jgi:hypothetical protein
MQRKWHRSVLEKDIDTVMVRMGRYVVMYPILFPRSDRGSIF